ncbi:hypothetical protein [Rhodococcus aetherivorans]|uniref:hypothetical protein n=1 Tax=Rhodococcus aetherivorans TaxID=191292 RepID=UPI00045CBCB4|nr:hypothetical protein [Rhodococcus aetherivorans]KDE14245.1 hypothetical protein N505_0105350 [Rhodococcus aetherivorans]
MALATVEDVEARLGRSLTTEETSRASALLEEASVLVEGYCGRGFVEPIPAAVPMVVSRMVARALETPTEAVGVQSVQRSAGPFGETLTFGENTSGGVWLASTDKIMLRGLRVGGSVSVGMVSERTL